MAGLASSAVISPSNEGIEARSGVRIEVEDSSCNSGEVLGK